ncbi:MAG: MFS transporter [Candidatus Nanopelagicales bacterium]
MTSMAPSRRRRAPLVGYLTSEVVSTTGTRMSMVAVPWFVLATTGSPALTGLAGFVEILPMVLVQGLGGPLVDRVGARRVAIAANAAAAVLVGAIPVLAALDHLTIPILLTLVGLRGAARGAASASNVLLPGDAGLAGTPIERATGLHDGMNRVAGMVGIPLAGVMMAIWSAPAVLIIDAVSFVVAGALIAALVPRAAQPPTIAPIPGGSATTAYLRNLREGLDFLRRTPILIAIASMVLVTNLLDQAYSAVLVPVCVADTLGGPLGLGLIGGAFGVGAAAGSATFAWLGPRIPRRMSFALGFLIGGAPRFLVLALAVTLPPVLAVSVVAGLGVGSINPALASTEYEAVPREMQARVLGAMAALAWAGMPLGALLGGVAVETLGLDTTLLLFGGAYLITTLAPFVLPVGREMDVLAATSRARDAQVQAGVTP